MASVIDALVVTLGLDNSKFKAASKETQADLGKTSEKANKTSKDMEAWGKHAAASISKLRNEVLGLLAVFTAGVGIKQFVENTISSTASLGRMSENLDMSAKSLSMWQLANKNAGGTVEGMTAQLKEAQQAIADYRLGQNNAANAGFWASGLASPGDFKDAETLLRARANAVQTLIARYGVGVGRSKAAQMGISEDTFNLLKRGATEVDRLRQAQERLAQAQANASGQAEEFRKKWDTLQNQFEAVGVQVLTALLPTLNRVADWLAANQDKVKEWGDKLATAATGFAGAISSAWTIVSPILGAIADGWKNIYGWVKLAGDAISKILPQKWLDKIGEGTAWLFDKLGIRGAVDNLMDGKGSTATPAAAGNAASSPSAGGTSKIADFNAKYGAAAAKAGAALGVDPRAILGQWGLETGWGKSIIPGTNNLGNIKDFSGGGVSAKDNMTGSVDKYRAYASAEEFADDYVSMLKRKFPKAVGAQSAEAFAQALKSGGYAEDPAYVAKLTRAAQMAGYGGAAGATSAAQVAQAAKSKGGSTSTTSTASNEVNINGDINVLTHATDANGVAKGMKQALTRYNFATQANTGLA